MELNSKSGRSTPAQKPYIRSYNEALRDLVQTQQNSKLHQHLMRVLTEHPEGISRSAVLKEVPELLPTLNLAAKKAGYAFISPKMFLAQMPGVRFREGLYFLSRTSSPEPGEAGSETSSATKQSNFREPESYKHIVQDLLRDLHTTELHKNLLLVLATNPYGLSCTALLSAVPALSRSLKTAAQKASVDYLSPKWFLMNVPGVRFAQGRFYFHRDLRRPPEESSSSSSSSVSDRKRASLTRESPPEKRRTRLEQNRPTHHNVEGEEDKELSEAETEAMRHLLLHLITHQMHKEMLELLRNHPRGMTCHEIVVSIRLQRELKHAARQAGLRYLPPTPCLRRLPGFVFDHGLFFLDPKFNEITSGQLNTIRQKELIKPLRLALPCKYNPDESATNSPREVEKESDPSFLEVSKTETDPATLEILARHFLQLLQGELGANENEWPDHVGTLETFLENNYTQATATVELVSWVADQPDIKAATQELFSDLCRSKCVELTEGERIVWHYQKVQEAFLKM